MVWLQTMAENGWTDEVASAWHLIEAQTYTDAWRVTHDPWDAANGSTHWRKGNRPKVALRLTDDASAAAAQSGTRVRSAWATTCGEA